MSTNTAADPRHADENSSRRRKPRAPKGSSAVKIHLNLFPGYAFDFDQKTDPAQLYKSAPPTFRTAFANAVKSVQALSRKLKKSTTSCEEAYNDPADMVVRIQISASRTLSFQFSDKIFGTTLKTTVAGLPFNALKQLQNAYTEMSALRKIIGKDIIGKGVTLK